MTNRFIPDATSRVWFATTALADPEAPTVSELNDALQLTAPGMVRTSGLMAMDEWVLEVETESAGDVFSGFAATRVRYRHAGSPPITRHYDDPLGGEIRTTLVEGTAGQMIIAKAGVGRCEVWPVEVILQRDSQVRSQSGPASFDIIYRVTGAPVIGTVPGGLPDPIIEITPGVGIAHQLTLSPSSNVETLTIEAPVDGWDAFRIDLTPLQSQPGTKAMIYVRPATGTNIIGPILRIDDAPNGAPILQLFNEGGLWVNDRIQFTHYIGGDYVRGVAMTWLDETANRAPALIFGATANPVADPWNVTADSEAITVDANKGTWLRRTDAGNIAASMTVTPDATRHNAIDLGSATVRWRDLFVQGGINIAGKVVTYLSSAVNGGDPEGQITAPVGSLCLSENGTIYRKATGAGNTGWLALQSEFITATVAGTAYQLQMADRGNLRVYTNANPVTVTIPTNATAPLPIGSVTQHMQYGAGQVSVVGAVGVNLRTRGGANKSAGQWARFALEKINLNEWVMSGDVTT